MLQSSVAVQVRAMIMVSPHRSVTWSWYSMVTEPQVSWAVAMPVAWGRVSSAYGYAQAKDGTWDWYREKTGNRFADRDDFADAVDFIAWYCSMSNKMLGISKWDAYSQYLAYHEGQGGYKRKSYKQKPWLLKVARQVDSRAKNYHTQLARCEDDLDSGWSLWPF